MIINYYIGLLYNNYNYCINILYLICLNIYFKDLIEYTSKQKDSSQFIKLPTTK